MMVHQHLSPCIIHSLLFVPGIVSRSLRIILCEVLSCKSYWHLTNFSTFNASLAGQLSTRAQGRDTSRPTTSSPGVEVKALWMLEERVDADCVSL